MQEMQDEFEDVLVEEPEDVPEAQHAHCTVFVDITLVSC